MSTKKILTLISTLLVVATIAIVVIKTEYGLEIVCIALALLSVPVGMIFVSEMVDYVNYIGYLLDNKFEEHNRKFMQPPTRSGNVLHLILGLSTIGIIQGFMYILVYFYEACKFYLPI